jgi:hypothetical protein
MMKWFSVQETMETNFAYKFPRQILQNISIFLIFYFIWMEGILTLKN